MGFFDSLLGKKEESYPELEASSQSATQLNSVKARLEEMLKGVEDRVEVLPADNAAYVFLGKPPKVFNLTWVENDKVMNFKKLISELGGTDVKVARLAKELGEIYKKHMQSERFSYKLAGRDVVVTPDDALVAEVKATIASVLH